MIVVEIPFIPASKKNRQRILRSSRTGRPFISSSRAARADEEFVRHLAEQAVSAAGCAEPVFPQQSVELELLVDPFLQTTRVRVRAIADKPIRGASGRRSDLHNALDGLCDALQGVVYANDNQVARINARRLLTPNDNA